MQAAIVAEAEYLPDSMCGASMCSRYGFVMNPAIDITSRTVIMNNKQLIN